MADNGTSVVDDIEAGMQYLTVTEAAREWGHTRNALLQHIARGRLKTYRVSKYYVIRRSDFNAFLAERASRAERRVAC